MCERARASACSLSHFPFFSHVSRLVVEQTAGPISREPSRDSDPLCRLVAGGRDSERGGVGEELRRRRWWGAEGRSRCGGSRTHTHRREVQGAMARTSAPLRLSSSWASTQRATTRRRTAADDSGNGNTVAPAQQHLPIIWN